MRPLPWVALFLGAGITIGSASPRRQVEPPTPILSVTTALVRLPVTVVDRKGAFVSGLRKEHFAVYDKGEPQAVEFFTSEEVPATIGLVIDSSGSMRGRREEVTVAAATFAAMSHPLDEFFTINFNEAVWPGLPPHVAFTADRDELEAALSRAPVEGMTALYDALDRALEHLEHGTRDRKALILVSDGGDNASSRSLDTVLEHARRNGAIVYSVTLFDPNNSDAKPRVLRKLAGETGGEAFTPKRFSEVIGSFARIAQDLRSGYTIGFVPPDDDPGWRAIRVVADTGDGRQLTVRTRAGYYARPSTGK